jgi:2-dehydro-3-deoxyphosphooctonate aldolase (KDO 8-P synthase)
MLIIAGPCVIESRDHCLMMADKIAEIGQRIGKDIIFKASYSKANRTSGDSYRGPGWEEGLKILADVPLATMTDFHTPQEAEAASWVHYAQVPALLSRQTDLLEALAQSSVMGINIKKGQFMAPQDVKHVVEKIRALNSGCEIWITERGTTFGYNNLVVDMRSFTMMRDCGADALIFDCTHSTQLPSAAGGKSGGQREMIAPLAQAAIAAGADGLFIETHNDPDSALSDGPCMLPLGELEDFLKRTVDLYNVIRKS